MDTPTSAAAKIEVTPIPPDPNLDFKRQARIEALKAASIGGSMVTPSADDKIKQADKLYDWLIQDIVEPKK